MRLSTRFCALRFFFFLLIIAVAWVLLLLCFSREWHTLISSFYVHLHLQSLNWDVPGPEISGLASQVHRMPDEKISYINMRILFTLQLFLIFDLVNIHSCLGAALNIRDLQLTGQSLSFFIRNLEYLGNSKREVNVKNSIKSLYHSLVIQVCFVSNQHYGKLITILDT